MAGFGQMTIVMLAYVVALLLLAAGFYFARLNEHLRAITAAASKAFVIMRDAAADDLEKEKTVQSCALAMVRGAVTLTVRLAVILLAAAFPVWLASALGWLNMELFWHFALRADVLLISTAVVLVPLFAMRHFRKQGS
jgi:hypothetical protein